MELKEEQKVNNNLAKYIVSTGDFTFTENDYKYVGKRFRYFFSFDSALEMYLHTLERLRTKYNQDRRGIRLSRVTFGKDGNIREHITLLLDMVEGKRRTNMKVFSVSKYVEDMRSYGHSDSAIRRYLLNWAAKCHGLTKEEMSEIRLLTHENWMEERKEEEINMGRKEEIKRKRRAWVFLPDRTKTIFNIYTDKVHSYIKWNKKWWIVIYRPEYGEYDVLGEANLEPLKERKEDK